MSPRVSLKLCGRRFPNVCPMLYTEFKGSISTCIFTTNFFQKENLEQLSWSLWSLFLRPLGPAPWTMQSLAYLAHVLQAPRAVHITMCPKRTGQQQEDYRTNYCIFSLNLSLPKIRWISALLYCSPPTHSPEAGSLFELRLGLSWLGWKPAIPRNPVSVPLRAGVTWVLGSELILRDTQQVLFITEPFLSPLKINL